MPFLSALGAEEEAVKVVRYPTAASGGYSELEAVARAHLPTAGPYVLLGESFSGPIAISLAASHPPGLAGLVLCCTFVRNPRPLFGGLRTLLGRLPAIAPPAGVLGRLLLGSFSTTALRTSFANALGQVPPATLRARLQAVLAVDVCTQLRSVSVPTLYLCAMQDRVVPRAAGQLIQKLLPRTRLVDVVAPHFLLQAAPVAAASVIREFMMEVQCAIPSF